MGGADSVINAAAIPASTIVIVNGLGKVPDPTTWFSTPRLYDEAARHIVREVVQFLGPLGDFIVAAGHNAGQLRVGRPRTTAHVPNISEFYEFLCIDRSYVLRKKRWP